MAREKLGEILIRAGLLDKAGLQRALNEQQRWGGQLGAYLVELGLITEETLVRALSTQYRIPAVALDPPKMNIAVGRLVPQDICERHGLVCFRADRNKRFLDIAMSDPSNVDAVDDVQMATECNIRTYLAAPSVIEKAINYVFYGEMSVGGEVDISPTSANRVDPQTSELLKKKGARGGPILGQGSAPWNPGIQEIGGSDAELQVEVSTSSGPLAGPAASSPGGAAAKAEFFEQVELPPPALDPNFHITLDVPAVDKQNLSSSVPPLEERLSMLEATVARNSSVIQVMLNTMLNKGLLTREEIVRILKKV